MQIGKELDFDASGKFYLNKTSKLLTHEKNIRSAA